MSTIALSCAALGVLLSARCNVFVFSPVIAQLERAAAFERRSGQSDSEEVMSSPTPYRNVTMFPGGGWRPFADAIGFAMRCYMLSRDSLNEQPHSSGDRGKAT